MLDAWAGPIFMGLLGLASVPFAIAHRRRIVRQRMNSRRAAWERKHQQ